MSYNGSGTFQINTSGQPVVAGTVISSTAFNALTADLATGLSTAITKDGQTATTARIPFAAGISSTLVTDSTSTSTGSIITAGGVGVAKALFVGTTANIAGVLSTTSPNITTSITTPSTSFDLINATATTLNLGGAATAVNVGAATGTMTVANTTLAAKAITASTTLNVTGVTTVQAGTAALPAITTSGDTNTGIFFPAADTVGVSTGGSERTRVDSSGNFGIGVTPSVWSIGKALEVGYTGNGVWAAAAADVRLVNNMIYTTGPAFKYGSTGYALMYQMSAGQHQWYNAPSGTVGGTITFTQAMTLDASGNLLVGDTTYRLSGIAAAGQAIQTGSRTFIGSNTSGDTSLGGLAGSNFTAIYSNGAEKARIDSSGFLGLNKTPARLLDMTAATAVSYMVSSTGTNTSYYAASNTGGAVYVGRENSVGGTFGTTAYSSVVWSEGAYPLVFATNNTEKMRIDSSGNLLVGESTATGNPLRGMQVLINSGQTSIVMGHVTGTTSGTQYLGFNFNGSVIGSITQSGTTAVLYNTTSDYRLKTVTSAVTGQGARIDALKPIDYQWKESNEQARGFLAHEFQEVYPSSVSGNKDAIDKDGKPAYQSMQAATSEVIADLVAEIQSLRQRLSAANL